MPRNDSPGTKDMSPVFSVPLPGFGKSTLVSVTELSEYQKCTTGEVSQQAVAEKGVPGTYPSAISISTLMWWPQSSGPPGKPLVVMPSVQIPPYIGKKIGAAN